MLRVFKEVLAEAKEIFCDQIIVWVLADMLTNAGIAINSYFNGHPSWSIVTNSLIGLLGFLPASFIVCFCIAPFALLKEKNNQINPKRDKPILKAELNDHVVLGSFLRVRITNKNGALINNARVWRFGLLPTVQDMFLRRQGDQIGPIDIQNGDEPVFDIANAHPKGSRLHFFGFIGGNRMGGDGSDYESIMPGTYQFTLRLLGDNTDPVEHSIKISLAPGEGAYRITILEG